MAGQVEYYKKSADEINNVSPSFCLAKWLQVTLHLQNGRNHSCHHPGTHTTPLEELENNPSALHNTTFKKGLRQQMLEGDRPKECAYCWNVEDLPGDHISDRIIKSSDPWAMPHMEKIVTADPDDNINPTYVEVSFSNVCNFKCAYCSPIHSSIWMHEVENEGPYELTNTLHNNVDWYKQNGEYPIHHKKHNPYVEAFWEWWPNLVKDLEIFRITGGEPLLDKNTFKVLDFLYDNPQPQLELAVNSNLGVPQDKINDYISKVKRLRNENKIKSTVLYTSVDAHGKQAEYGRHGLDYDQWIKNLDMLLEELQTDKVVIMCTANIFSITTFKELLEDVWRLKLKHWTQARPNPLTIDMSILRWPRHQCAAILPPEYADEFMQPALDYMKDKIEKPYGEFQYQGFYDFEIAKMERFIDFIRNGAEYAEEIHIPTARSDFYLFINEHDARRDVNFLETFPELEPFYRLCEEENNKRII